MFWNGTVFAHSYAGKVIVILMTVLDMGKYEK